MEAEINIVHPYEPEKMYVYRDRLELLKQGSIVPPVTVDVDLTDSCDHKCPWCEYAKFRVKDPQLLSKDVVFRLLDDLAGSPVKGLIFAGGGEPTTYPYFREVTDGITDNRLKAVLFTHGGHIHRFADQIARSFIHVRVSLDAGSNVTHAEYHSSGDPNSFSLVFDNLRLLHRLNPSICLEVSFIVAEKNYAEIDCMAEVLRAIPVDFLLIKFSRFARDNRWVTDEKLERIKEQVTDLKKILTVYYRDPVLVEQEQFPIRVCRTTYLKTLVAPDGNVYVCNQRRGEKKMAFGSLYEKGFWEIWESEYHKMVYAGINTDECSPCRHIPYNQLLDLVQDSQIPKVDASEQVKELTAFL